MAYQRPQFPVGQASFMKYVNEKVGEAQNMEGDGRVIVEFVVNADGKISDAKVKRAVCPSIDNEAIRIVQNMPVWEPGKLKGEAVNVKYTLPIMFKKK